MNNNNRKTKKKKRKTTIELSIQFLVFLLSSKTASKQYTWPDLGGKVSPETSSSGGEKKPWRFVSMVYIDFYTFYMLIYMYGMYIVETKNDKHKSHKSILQSSTTTVNH